MQGLVKWTWSYPKHVRTGRKTWTCLRITELIPLVTQHSASYRGDAKKMKVKGHETGGWSNQKIFLIVFSRQIF
jgi:hypothetical protein